VARARRAVVDKGVDLVGTLVEQVVEFLNRDGPLAVKAGHLTVLDRDGCAIGQSPVDAPGGPR
jgi:hypothetical protein